MDSYWSGMVVKADAGSGIFSVSGQWTVPDIKPTDPGASSCYVWIGIDGGDGPRYLLQAGIGCDMKGGKLTIAAWWEWIPLAATPPRGLFPVSVGDQILCAITGQLGTNTATITLRNLRTGQTANFGNSVRGMKGVALQGSCAEWIVEAPIVDGVRTMMSNYGQVQFCSCSASQSSGGTTKTLDPNGGTPVDSKQNNQTISRGSSPGLGQVVCKYGPDTSGSLSSNAISQGSSPRAGLVNCTNGSITSGSLPSPNVISSRALTAENAIASRSLNTGTSLRLNS
jgi:hypothetical protein